MRLKPGPVFEFECITAARRWQLYATRVLFVTGLLAAMVVMWESQAAGPSPTTARTLAEVGAGYFCALVGTQLALVLLAAPAFTAGAICIDRARGTLAHVLTTDLSSTEIVLGKLGAGLMPVVGLVVCTLPVMSLGTLLGGLDPQAVGAAFLVALAVAILGCALALAVSVGVAKTHEALMAVYAFWTLALLVYPLWLGFTGSGALSAGPPRWLLKFNPYWLSFAPYLAPNQVDWTDFALFLGVALALSAGLTVVSIVRLRPVTAQLAGRSSAASKGRSRRTFLARLGRLLPGPSLDGNPVLWREWHSNRSSRLSRLLWGVYFGGLSSGAIAFLAEVQGSGLPRMPVLGLTVITLGVTLGLLLLSVTSSNSLFEERIRGTLDVLLSTPLPTRSIVWGKWWGAFRVVPLLALWPTVMMALFAYARPAAGLATAPSGQLPEGVRGFLVVLMPLIVLIHGAAITSLGLALATWISRPGRAVFLSVAAYVLVSVGWVLMILTLVEHGPREALRLADLSPIFASVHLCEEMFEQPADVIWTCVSTTFWLHGVAGVCAFFTILTLATFDQCLGRIADGSALGRDWHA